MKVRYQWKPEDSIYTIIGCIIFTAVVREAFSIPVTHDEVSTIAFSKQTLIDIITYADPIPNNHILNTILLKINIGIFGDHLFTNRLHNYLSFIPFFLFTVLLSRQLFRESWIRMVLVLLIVAQPYLLDFFSVTRGYGLSVAFEMVSLYFLFRALKSYSEPDFVRAVAFGALGVYANFTLLNYYIPAVMLLGAYILYYRYHTDRTKVYRIVGKMAGISLGLGMLSFLPFKKMMATKQFIYWGTNGFMTDTVKPLLISLRSGTEYFGWTNDQVYLFLLLLIIITILVGLVLFRSISDKRLYLFSVVLLASVILYNHVQFWIAGVPFLNARTSLFFIPLVSIVMTFGVESLFLWRARAGLFVAVFMMALSVQHFIRGYNGSSTYEWYFDADTYTVLQDLEELTKNESNNELIKIDCHWTFHPSLSYHVEKQRGARFVVLPYHKEMAIDSDAKYYYTQSDEWEKLSTRYDKVKEYGWGSRILLKLK